MATRANGDERGAVKAEPIPALCRPDREDELSPDETRALLSHVDTLLQRRPAADLAADVEDLSRRDGVVKAVLFGNGGVARESRAKVRDLVESVVRDHADVVAAPEEGWPLEGSAGFLDPRATVPAILMGPLREVRLEEMRTWTNDAVVVLHDLVAGRMGIGPGSRPLSSEVGDATREVTRQLLEGLSANALDISRLESERHNWSASAHAAREAIRFRRELAVEATGELIPAETEAEVQQAFAEFMEQGVTPELLENLDTALEENPESLELAYWSANYLLMAGRYDEAYAAVEQFEGDPAADAILALVDPSRTEQEPEKGHPSNFYTYQHLIVDDAAIDRLGVQLDEVLKITELPVDPSLPIALSVQDLLASAVREGMAAASKEPEKDTSDQEPPEPVVPPFDPNSKEPGLSPDEKARRGGNTAANTQARDRAAARDQTETWAQQVTLTTLHAQARVAQTALECLRHWSAAHRELRKARYRAAERNYAACQMAIVAYLAQRYPEHCSPVKTQAEAYTQLLRVAAHLIAPERLESHFRLRHREVDLDQLNDRDWVAPTRGPAGFRIYHHGLEFLNALIDPSGAGSNEVQLRMDAPLLTIGLVFAPLGLAECHRVRRNYANALGEYDALLQRHDQVSLLSEVIEVPFVTLMKGQVLLEQGDHHYKAHRTTDARQSYNKILAETFADQGGYVELVETGAEGLQEEIGDLLERTLLPLALEEPPPVGETLPPLIAPAERSRLEAVGNDIPIETISSRHGDLPGTERGVDPNEALLRIQPAGEGVALRESNPIVYALLCEAKSRLIQLDAGLNYLGYQAEYVPPWRFQFLLDRARYFAEHARNAERDFLNFLNRSEDEEFRERGAGQNVALEKASVGIETARVEQSRLESTAARESNELAELAANNAERRVRDFRHFSARADELADGILGSSLGATIAGSVSGAVGTGATGISVASSIAHAAGVGLTTGLALGPVGVVLGAGIGAVVGGVASLIGGLFGQDVRAKELEIAREQRQLELENLQRSKAESESAAEVAAAQLEVAKAAFAVATLQRSACLLRHDFAVQNLTFLQDRTLNAELWFRLTQLLRTVANTYLRYAVEIAFLAEQAYEFEVDRQLNVIRFDYDASETANLLAADFLLKDLDTLEQDMIVTQRLRQQQVRHVISLARDFPTALQELREEGSAVFALPLQHLERRFPGLHNVRVGSLSVLPVALMDPTRFSLELTYLGASQIRMKGRSVAIPGASTPSWLPGLDSQWPVKTRVTGAETVVFSGLTRADEQAAFPFTVGNQRNPFENLPAAASWHVEMSLRENQVVPGSLADVLITLDLSGYHDPPLQAAIETSPAPTEVLTQFVSARQFFPDAFYEFNRAGALEAEVTSDLLSMARPTGTLRNLGFLLVPEAGQPQFSRLVSTHAVAFTTSTGGRLGPVSPVPQLSFEASGLSLTATIVGLGRLKAEVLVSFGDGSAFESLGQATDELQATHDYGRPGEYKFTLRLLLDGRLIDYHASVAVSRAGSIPGPLTAYPRLTGIGNRLELEAEGFGDAAITTQWTLLEASESGPPTRKTASGPTTAFDLNSASSYVLLFTAMRDLSAHVHGRQRTSQGPVSINRFRVASNRTFDDTGNETNTTGRNPLATQLFGGGPLSPIDRWTLELPGELNPFLRTVTASDQQELALGIDDVILMLEYETAGP